MKPSTSHCITQKNCFNIALILSFLFSGSFADSLNTLESNATRPDNETRKVNLGRSVVTASGYEQDMKTAPASISIIPKEEILTRPIRDIGDAVQDVPGVYVEQDKTGQNSISMRGLSSTYTLILIDGKRQNTTRGFVQNGLGNQTSFMPPPSMIERIEVIRGPASTIYGSDAMGGVINIITKKHTNTFTSGIQMETKLFEPNSEWGNVYGTNAYMNIPLLKDKLSLNLRGSARYNDANEFLKPSWVSPSKNGNPYAAHSSTGSRNFSGGFRLNYTPTNRDYIYLDSEVYNGRLGTLNTSSRSITSIQELFKVNSVLSHDGNYEWGKLSSYVQHSYNLIAPHANVGIGADKGDYINYANKRTSQNAIFQSTYTNDFDLNNYGAIIFNGGVYYQFENLIGTISSKHRNMHQNQAAIFAEGEYLISESISTTLGLRYNYSDRFATVPNPRFYVNYNPTDWLTFKAGVANGMLIPTLLQTTDGVITTSTSSGNSTSTTESYGNPNLKPEQSWNYELSAIVDTDPAMFILTGYYTDFNNQIETLQGITGNAQIPGTNQICPGSSTCSTYRNVEKSLVSGAELSAKIKPIGGFSLDAGYGYTYTKALSGSGKGEPINSIPRHSFTITPKYQYGNFDMYVRWSGKYKTPTPYAGSNARTNVREIVGQYYKDYQLVDVAASYKIGKHYALTLAVNNLFDVYFMDYASYTTNGGSGGQGSTTNAQNKYQRILPSRNYWISFRADF
ncbi:TonB-dependent receptor domain-containing protein [Helicobacter cinaedi]|uniref:TonB-dependent receptor domain-containing protein n=1 Tax=Helicobacter cinaedi TaxID=213 RepID=UPI000CF0C1D2|nr:TonB-dependent receptor [Helicobacter cinaedi]QOQ96682.1 TonB-dependent receptor [Helicobacter cinaedi]